VGKSVRQTGRPSAGRAGSPAAPSVALRPAQEWPAWLHVGLPLFFLACAAYGVLDVHYSTDTWIGLAAGRDILAQPTFPKTDTWTYTFPGRTWINQNWLSHMFSWWLYDRLGANAVAIGTWVVDIAIFTLVLVATRLRCGSWRAAALSAALVALATRDWLSPRPATIQLLLLALLWLSFSALLSQGARPRWWAILLLVPVLLVWPHTHGSFVFGYAATGGFLLCALVPVVFGRQAAISRGQGAVIVGIALVTAVLSMALSPYGVENLTHPLVVAESQVFRQVNEWLPPFRSAPFPPVGSFWGLLGTALGCVLVVLLLRAWERRGKTDAPPGVNARAATIPRAGWQGLLFDLGAVAIGLGMAMSARRFIALFYVLATPAVVTWLVRLGHGLSANSRRRVVGGLTLLAWPGAALVAYLAVARIYEDIATGFPSGPHFNLLERVTRADQSSRDAAEFFRRNGLQPNLFTEWPLAGALLFDAPGVRVFIDGRAQQLFPEQHVLKYCALLEFKDADEPNVFKILDECGTDAVLAQGAEILGRLTAALDRNPRWFRIIDTPRCHLFVARGTAFAADLGRREHAGELWWPDTPETMVGRGRLLILSDAKDWRRAVEFWQSAVAQRPELGLVCYGTITAVLVQAGRAEEARAYLQSERTKVSQVGVALAEREHNRLLAEIDRCAGLAARPAPVPP